MNNFTHQLFRDHYKIWIERDKFELASLNGAFGPPPSMREFIHLMANGNAVGAKFQVKANMAFPDMTDLNQTFDQFLKMSIVAGDVGRAMVGDMVFGQFCLGAIDGLADEIAHAGLSPEKSANLFEEMSVSNWKAWRKAIGDSETRHRIADVLYADLTACYSKRPLMSFFLNEPGPNGFFLWGDGASTPFGRSLAIHALSEGDLSVDVHVQRYDEDIGDTGVTAFEWKAITTIKGSSRIEAVACGMVYVFDRIDGNPVSSITDFLMTADQVADTDVLQVNAFLKQHSDAEQLIADSDLCFVWLWERNKEASRGTGAQCLRLAVADLKERFKKIRTLVVNSLPAQFDVWGDSWDPPMVTVAKQTAIDQLTSYIGTLSIPGVSIRHIFNTNGGDPMSAMEALGEAFLETSLDDSATQDAKIVDDLNISEDEKSNLGETLRLAGLFDLSDEVVAGIASIFDVKVALASILLYQRIPYVPLAFRGPIGVGDSNGPLEIPEDDWDDADISDFVDSVPSYADVRCVRVMQESPNEDLTAYVILVQVNTVVGLVESWFSMIPLPRPIDGSSLLAD